MSPRIGAAEPGNRRQRRRAIVWAGGPVPALTDVMSEAPERHLGHAESGNRTITYNFAEKSLPETTRRAED